MDLPAIPGNDGTGAGVGSEPNETEYRVDRGINDEYMDNILEDLANLKRYKLNVSAKKTFMWLVMSCLDIIWRNK